MTNNFVRWLTKSPLTVRWPIPGNAQIPTKRHLERGLPRQHAVFSSLITSLVLSALALVLLASSAAAQTCTPTPNATYGPRASQAKPANAVELAAGSKLQTAVNAYPAGTVFWLRAGVYSITAPVTPKSGNQFIGEYGACLDGTGWSTADDTQGAFRAHNQDIDYVIIRNLVIRNMPQKGIQAFKDFADHWTIEYNEIAYNKYGLEFAPYFIIRNNYIHHNISSTPQAANPAERGGGYIAQGANGAILEGNEISYNGPEQKVLHSVGVVFRNNFVHHNYYDGIWYDTNYADAKALVEGNRVEDNGRDGITLEATDGGIIRNNTVRRNATNGVLLFRSQNIETYLNTLDSNLGGIDYYYICETMLPGEDLANNHTHDNVIIVSARSNAWGASFSHSGCDASGLAPFLSGAKNLTFARNTYTVPSPSGLYWIWGGVYKTWAQWQAIPQDVSGAIGGSVGPPPPPNVRLVDP